MQLSDYEFINQFEDQTLDPVHFNHIGHLRLCWLYLQEDTLETAIEKTCKGIQLYASSQGVTDKFHRTITEFLVRLINSRATNQSIDSFDIFLRTNKDLVKDAQSVLGQFYSSSLLSSKAARASYLRPDLLKLAS